MLPRLVVIHNHVVTLLTHRRGKVPNNCVAMPWTLALVAALKVTRELRHDKLSVLMV